MDLETFHWPVHRAYLCRCVVLSQIYHFLCVIRWEGNACWLSVVVCKSQLSIEKWRFVCSQWSFSCVSLPLRREKFHTLKDYLSMSVSVEKRRFVCSQWSSCSFNFPLRREKFHALSGHLRMSRCHWEKKGCVLSMVSYSMSVFHWEKKTFILSAVSSHIELSSCNLPVQGSSGKVRDGVDVNMPCVIHWEGKICMLSAVVLSISFPSAISRFSYCEFWDTRWCWRTLRREGLHALNGHFGFQFSIEKRRVLYSQW